MRTLARILAAVASTILIVFLAASLVGTVYVAVEMYMMGHVWFASAIALVLLALAMGGVAEMLDRWASKREAQP